MATNKIIMFPFEKLGIWQKSIGFIDSVYRLTQGFPAEERFGLANQMRRAAVSLASNIAEGSAGYSRADFAHFVEIATGSLFELVAQASIARKQGYLAETDFSKLYVSAEELGRMLSGLRKSLTPS